MYRWMHYTELSIHVGNSIKFDGNNWQGSGLPERSPAHCYNLLSNPNPHFSQSSEDLIRSERNRECKSGRLREVEASALNIFALIEQPE
jgi:hypothetical protein